VVVALNSHGEPERQTPGESCEAITRPRLVFHHWCDPPDYDVAHSEVWLYMPPQDGCQERWKVEPDESGRPVLRELRRSAVGGGDVPSSAPRKRDARAALKALLDQLEEVGGDVARSARPALDRAGFTATDWRNQRVSDISYAPFLRAYDDAVQAGSRKVLKDAAEAFGCTYNTMKGQVERARDRGLLIDQELTDEGRRLLAPLVV